MNKLLLSLAFLFAGIAGANAQSLSQSQPGIDGNDTQVRITVYPNPTKDFVNVVFEKPVKEPIIETFNVNGQRMPAPGNGGGDGSGSNKTEIDLSMLPPGLYVVRVCDGKEVLHVQRIIKY